jgi:KDO2-lipid IV(A) lauroyltransferase
MFVEFAYCLSETLERYGPRPMPVRVDMPEIDVVEGVLKAGQGVIVATGHLGNWDVAAAELLRYRRPTHVVMAHEPNPSTNEYVERLHDGLGLDIVYSDQSVLASLELLHALRRNEIVAMQIDRVARSETAREVELFGGTVRFPRGPFELARLSGAPLVAVFAPRVGARHYQIHFGEPRTLARSASAEEVIRCMQGVAAEMEEMIRRSPHQWFQFEPFWVDDTKPPLDNRLEPSRARVLKDGASGRVYPRRESAMRSRTMSRRRSRSS